MKTFHLVDDFETVLRQRLSIRFDCKDPVGYSNREIEEHLSFFPHDLGEIYRTFLRVCGKHNGGMFIHGHHWQLTELPARNKEMRLVATEYELTMPETMFSFLDYIGDYFWCIKGDDGANPAVVRFDLDEFVPMTGNLSSFLLQWEELDE